MCLFYGLDLVEKEVSMQNNSKYFIVIALVLALISYVLTQDEKSAVTAADTLLIPELQDKVNDVDGVSLSQGQESLDFYKEDGVWRIKQLDLFFADTNKIAQMLLSLRKFKLKQPKTSNAKNYAKLGLAEPQVINVVLKNNDQVFADIDIGKQALKTQGSYVRKKADKQSWLSNGQLTISLNKDDWIIKNIIDVDATQIQSVSYQPTTGNAFKIAKKQLTDESFQLEPITQGQQLKSGLDLNSLANGLSKFTVDNVVSGKTLEESNKVNTVTYNLFNGPVYQLQLYNQEGKNYLKISVQNADSLSAIEKQLDKWLFTLPQFKFDALNKSMTDILEAQPTKKTEKDN